MASTPQFAEFVVEQFNSSGHVTARKMFGEYTLYWDAKPFALVCDNKLYVKPTAAGRAFLPEVTEAAPYPGAKPCFLVEEQLEDREWLANLARLTVEELPEPKPKTKKQRGGQ
ncbi:competence protein TfoX [Hymenobacter amundsenii]|uniref:Competence protein TfoX n=1 Tax=Hymenobacter amundsenii TaxID=2006685 RepID=A0A246FQK4_9BACT|nr:TfoX/Sxy family protein [Hymenobacter amundsenii]OWP65046.1 competence protein TfoX [Hymenobacter amundsenii]